MTQTENTEMVQTRISPQAKLALRRAARAEGLSDAALVRKLILLHVREPKIVRSYTVENEED